MPYQDRELSVERRTQDLMGRMSLEEKVGQLVQADGRKQAAEQVRERRVGSFLHILGAPTVELQKLAEKTGHGIPILFGIDAIHGHGFWEGATVFPTQLGISCSWNPELLELMGRITAREMLATGLHWTFSPVLCLARDMRWGRVGETFGEDPHLLGVLGAALVRGYQGKSLSDPDSVIACAKHFAGYSETVGGRDASEAEISERKLRTYFLPPFREMVKAGCRSFMTAYQCIDGVACVVNRWLLTDVLRGEWGFNGFVVTDWNNVGRTHTEQGLYPSIEAAVPASIHAGNDMIMVTPEFYEGALAQIRKGNLAKEDVELACKRVLSHKFEFGLFDHKRYPPINQVAEIVGSPQHREPLLRCALESIVLLKNEKPEGATKRILPLSSNIRHLALLGPNADDILAQLGDWSFGSGQAGLNTAGHPRHLVSTVRDGVREKARTRAIGVDYERGCEVMSDDLSHVKRAADLAAAADVAVVVVGDVLDQTGETKDRYELDLTGGQMPLLQAVKKTGTPLVVVLINSKPLCIPWVAQHADAIVEAFNPGMRGGEAIAEILFGESNPMGKLSVSFPAAVGQQPVYYQQVPGWHGNKHNNYTSKPLFAFGYGLSFTSYSYERLELSAHEIRAGQSLEVHVDVKNSGGRAGTEIVQLYLNDVFSSLSTPEKTLKGYQRVHLERGQTETVRFEIKPEDLSFIGRDGRPVTEPGEFEVMVGSSSRDEDLLRARFTLVE
ncbi:MAG TPA: glycoside hydrolase family 3 N-terminal domain-containing protein [Polyangiaceae bacterium]|nr:glycoside hydrolase family 3 N-terminal domain-containing protein [Polyangiaceae bacterium]